eukprot:scaffold17443_cov38-Cyclotella_meneghiniana.AAC.6
MDLNLDSEPSLTDKLDYANTIGTKIGYALAITSIRSEDEDSSDYNIIPSEKLESFASHPLIQYIKNTLPHQYSSSFNEIVLKSDTPEQVFEYYSLQHWKENPNETESDENGPQLITIPHFDNNNEDNDGTAIRTVNNSNGWSSARLVRDHLTQAHNRELSKLTDAELELNDLFVCRECDDKLFVSCTALNTHVRTNHVEHRTHNNLRLVEDHLFKSLGYDYDSHWVDGLNFLSTLELTPPPFQQPLTTKIKYRLEQTICTTFLTTVHLSNEALKPHQNDKFAKKRDFDPWPILLLQILFERLVLFPAPPESPNKNNKKKDSLNQTIHARLRKFKQGKLRELYEESQLVQSKSPLQQAQNPPNIQKSAQLAANLDNFKSANARICKHAPIASINKDNLHVLQNLHPPSLDRGCCKPRQSTRTGGTKRKLNFTPQQILSVLSHLHRGKAPGIQCDSLDIYIKSAKFIKLAHEDGQAQGKALAQFFSKVTNGEVPEKFKLFLRQTYLVALEKDPDDKTKLRPLGVPSAIRRISSILILSEYSPTLAEYLLPFNYAVGVSGGVDFIIKNIQLGLGVDKYITQKENQNELPTRALVSLDIKNMFNAVSRERLREIISEKFPTLEDFSDLIMMALERPS